MKLETGSSKKRHAIDSTKIKDSGKDFGVIFRDYHDPERKEYRKIIVNRELRERLKKEDAGL